MGALRYLNRVDHYVKSMVVDGVEGNQLAVIVSSAIYREIVYGLGVCALDPGCRGLESVSHCICDGLNIGYGPVEIFVWQYF